VAATTDRPFSAGNLVCDLDGVVYRGDATIPGSGDALAEIEAAGFRLVFATNNSSKTDDRVADKILRVAGYPARVEQVVTSARAAASLLAGGTERVLVVGGEGLRVAMQEAGHLLVDSGREATAVAVGFDRDLSYDRLKEATIALNAGARFIASNLDTTFPAAGDDLWPGAGSMVAALEASSGREAEAAGKPFAPMQQLIASRLTAGPTWVVGDRPETDLELGRSAGWKTVLTLSGVTPAGAVDGIAADAIVQSIAELPAVLSAS
jgi:HAD superfamily hydrolase (TIGR01450 family)